MFHIDGEMTDTPTVDYTTGRADVSCDVCNVVKADFPLRIAARFVGGGFVLESNVFGCSCGQATVYPLRGMEPMSKILTKLAGF